MVFRVAGRVDRLDTDRAVRAHLEGAQARVRDAVVADELQRRLALLDRHVEEEVPHAGAGDLRRASRGDRQARRDLGLDLHLDLGYLARPSLAVHHDNVRVVGVPAAAHTYLGIADVDYRPVVRRPVRLVLERDARHRNMLDDALANRLPTGAPAPVDA